MTARVDFSRNARVYDQRHGFVLPDESLQTLWKEAGLSAGASVVDVGAGTGRVAIAFAKHGCRVVAVEPSTDMLAQLRGKGCDSGVVAVAAEGASLPFPPAVFDAVVLARLLYLTPDWRAILEQAHRVLAIGGLLLHEWSNGESGEEWVQIREEARRLFQRAGVKAPFHPGVRSEAEVDREALSLGLMPEARVDLGPGPTLTLGEFLRRLEGGELSYIWGVPKSVLGECLPGLRRWAANKYDLDRATAMPRQMSWTIYRKW